MNIMKFIKSASYYVMLSIITLHVTGSYLSTISKTQIDFCEKWQFQCNNEQCIHESFACDGILDCTDGSDESYKQCKNKTCDKNSFQCDYGACIDEEYQCDGLNQCNDGSDEKPEKCNMIEDENQRYKRDMNNMCSAPSPSPEKSITYICGEREESKSCQKDGFVPEFTIATVKCKSTYYLINNTSTYHRSVCIEKTWVPPINECFKKCEEAIPIYIDLRCFRKGISIHCDNTTMLSGTKIRIGPSCRMAQEDGSPEITCQDDGTWDKPLSLCAPDVGICTPYRDQTQTCVKIKDCPTARSIIANKRAVLCGYSNDREERMCCPSSTPSQNDTSSLMYLSYDPLVHIQSNQSTNISSKNSTAIAISYCEKYSSSYETECINAEPPIGERVKALPKEYPHVALLGLGRNLQQFVWCCVGTLISETFILSVANCCEQFRRGEIKWAVMGNVNYLSAINNDDINQTTVYNVVKRYDYPTFKLRTFHDNIALFQLETPVVMSPHIRPACLFTPNSDHRGVKFRTVGFGSALYVDSLTDNLLKSTITAVDEGKCTAQVENWDFDPKSVMCVGDLGDGEAFCMGSPGSPLELQMHKNSCTWTVFALKSFANLQMKTCGETAKANPYTYTKIPYYLDWIQSIVWP